MMAEAQRIVIAEACEWANAMLRNGTVVPDYLNDLNAMHEVEKFIPAHKRGFYNAELSKTAVSGRNLSSTIREPDWIFQLLNATAAQRAEAFIRTLGKWVD